MANNHAHGAFGAQLLANRNLTPHTSAMSFTPSVDVYEDTGLSPQGDGKTYLQALRGAAASSSLFVVNDPDWIDAETRYVQGESLSNELLTQGWFGFGVGKFLTMSNARKTSLTDSNSTGSVASLSVNHQLQAQYYHGWALANPFGLSVYTGAEVQTITFNAADVNQFFGLRFAGKTDVFEFHSDINNTALKAGIEGLLDLIAGLEAVTVTVTGSVTGTSTKSGTKTLTFSGTTDVPTLEVISGAVRRYLVSSGDGDSDYRADGGATFTLGISQSAFQANQRAINTAHANVVTIGSSTAYVASVGAVTVSGAGTTAQNGDYAETAVILYGKAAYHKSGTDYWLVFSTSDYWCLIQVVDAGEDPTEDSNGWITNYRQNTPTETTNGSEYLATNGSAPPPTVSAPIEGATTLGTADFFSYFPIVATPGAPSAAGTGATHTVIFTAGSHATTIDMTTLTSGGTSEAIYNFITSTTTLAAHDGAAFLPDGETTTATGFYCRMQIPFAVGTALVVVVEHSDSPSSGYATLHTFGSVINPADETLLVQEYSAPANTVVKRYVRVRITSVTGTYAVFVGYSRKS